jgi:hypothetical protein
VFFFKIGLRFVIVERRLIATPVVADTTSDINIVDWDLYASDFQSIYVTELCLLHLRLERLHLEVQRSCGVPLTVLSQNQRGISSLRGWSQKWASV